MKVRRRDFLKTASAVGVGLLVYSPALNAFDKQSGPLKASRTGDWIASTCQGCTTWCPVEVMVQDDGSIIRAVKVRGNANSMTGSGSVCPRGHLIPQQMYDPDRIKVPMKRTNPVKGKGVDPQFIPITWAQAMDEIATKMMELRTDNETHKFLYLRGRYSYANEILYKEIPKIFGTPNGISHSAICAEAEKAGPYFTEHYWGYRDYDLANTQYLVLWGVDPFRSNRQPTAAMNKWATLKANNATVAVIDPVLSAAGAKADKWYPVTPGEDGALASAIAHHILVQGSWHKAFVGDFDDSINHFVANTVVDIIVNPFTGAKTHGLIEWWNVELKDKTPAWAAGITGIAESEIIALAEGMAAAAPAVSVWLGPGPVMSTRGTYTSMAIHALNGLLGSVENVGGPQHTASSSIASIPSTYSSYQDATALNGLGYSKIDQRGTLKFPAMKKGSPGGGVVTNNVANAINDQDPYNIRMAIGNWCNFAFSGMQPERWYQALASIYFVHITTNASEMSQFADIILPAAFSTTEKLSLVKSHSNKYTGVSIQQPLADRLFDVKTDETEIPYMLAEALDAKGFSNLLNYFNTEFIDPETAATPTDEASFAEIAIKMFTQPAWSADPNTGNWAAFKNVGVVNFGPVAYEAHWADFGTPTGKFEFYSESLKSGLQEHATDHATTVDDVLSQCNYVAQGELAFVPHYEPPYRWGSVADYPFTFVDIKSRYNREGRSQNLPFYYQFKKLDPGDENWDDVIKMNPQDANNLGIVDGDLVQVTSPTGTLKTRAKLWEGLRPGTVAKTFGQGHWSYGRVASDYGNLQEHTGQGNNNEILPDDYDRISGSSARNGGYVGVNIEKII